MQTLDIKQGSRAISSKRIMVVDDEPFVCDAVKMMLNFDGHRVETALNAQDALALLEEEEFDLVITDFAMPGMRGSEMATVIKSQRPGLPVVMITAYAEMLDPSDNSLRSVDCVVSKPFMLDDLRAAITKAMSSAS